MIYNRISVTFGAFSQITGPTISYQYDAYQILVISGITLPEYYEVDFCNEGDTTTTTMVGTSDGVLIPNAYLRTGKKVKAYIVVQGEDEGAIETRYEVTLPVRVRPAREDIDPTPAEQQQIDELISAMNDAVEDAGAAKTAAEAAQEAAEAAVAHYPKIEDGYWYVWHNDGWINTGIKAEGVDGVGISSVSGVKSSTSDLVDTYTLTVTYTDGDTDTITFTVTNGKDAVSPEVTISTITGGHRVTITDEDHPSGQSFDVMDGEDGVIQSVNGKSAASITLDAGDIGYDDTETYASGSIGAETALLNNASADLSSVISAEDEVIKSEHNLINYGYDTPEHRAAVPSASDSTKLGFDRTGQVVTLNGGGLSSSAIIVKINNTVQTTVSSSTVKGWAVSVLLESGKTYRFTAKLLSGTISTPSNIGLSIYKSGSASTSGVAFANEANTVFGRTIVGDGSLYNIAFYIVAGTTFTNAKYLVCMEDITHGGYSESDAFEYCDGRINRLHNLIKYYDDCKIDEAATGATTSYSSIGVERLGTVLKLNYAGNGGSSHTKRVKLSNSIARADGTSYTSWPRDLQLVEGQEYRLKIKKLSGSSSLMNGNAYFPTLVVYETGVNTTITTQLVSEPSYGEYSFVAPTGGLVCLALYATNNAVFTDLVVEVTLEEYHDEAAPIADYYTAEAADTIRKVRDEITSPSMVFLWATDIHRMSSNAAVQTFSKMIANMAYVSKEVPCGFILNTGDLTDGDVIQATTLSRAYDCLTEFRSIGLPYVWAMGNHDTNPYTTGQANLFTIDECYKAYFPAMMDAHYHAAESGTNYYVDFNGLDIRLISLNANNVHSTVPYAYSTNTASWLTSALDTQKTVFVVLHQSPYTAQVYENKATTNAADVRTALEAFVNNGGNLIMLSGHSHCDVAYISPFVSIMQCCQRFSSIAEDITDQAHDMTGFIDVVRFPAREQYAATEDCWSVGVYKPDSNELSLIRFGAGKDRYFHITPITPDTVTTKLTGTITWSSSNTSVATVADGVISGVATGKCAVLAKDETGNYECWIVSVS